MPTKSKDFNYDCLLTIFEIVTAQVPDKTTEQGRPLDVVRAASQVCQGWRRLLLMSPLIWGRVVDLGHKDYGSQRRQWMEEVVRRAGSAPLWISGKVTDRAHHSKSFDPLAFFIQLLASWERIEKLSVALHGKEIPEIIQNHFLSPAPILQLFEVDLVNISRPLFLNQKYQFTPSRQLFSNHAPLLAEFKAAKIGFQTDAQWLSTIRNIDPSPYWMPHKGLLDLFRHTPSLERFLLEKRFCALERPLRTDSDSKQYLPNLSSIDLEWSVNSIASLISYLSPGKLHFVSIEARDYRVKINNHTTLARLKNAFALYLFNYFGSHPSTSVSVFLGSIGVTFSDGSAPRRCASKSNNRMRSFDITISHQFETQSDTEAVWICLLDAVLAASNMSANRDLFKPVTEIALYMFRMLKDKTSVTLYTHLYTTLALFDHVQCILINEWSSHILWNALVGRDKTGALHDHRHVIFPQLHTVRLLGISDHVKPDRRETDPYFKDFFLERKKIGVPVAVFDLTTCYWSYYAKDLRELEQVEGLEVVWRRRRAEGDGAAIGSGEQICRYVCGSGDPERLRGIF